MVIDKINEVLYHVLFVSLLLCFLKMFFIGPCHLRGYFFDKEYRERFTEWMHNQPKFKSKKKSSKIRQFICQKIADWYFFNAKERSGYIHKYVLWIDLKFKRITVKQMFKYYKKRKNLNYFFFSQKQESITEQQRFIDDDDDVYKPMFVKINGKWKQFSEINREKCPCGTFIDYEYIGCLTDKEYNSGENIKYGNN
jgi:hypothetical protein